MTIITEILEDDFFAPFIKGKALEIKNLLKINKEEFAENQHFFAGMQIRNHFKLWDSENKYHKYFASRGITHPDSMSNEILLELYDYLEKKYL